MKISEINFSQNLIRIPSYSGFNHEIINLINETLCNLEFKCDILEFDGNNSYKVNNIHAIYNPNNHSKTLYFAGHTDIVKEGNIALWSHSPFDAKIVDNKMIGRGASDMKCAIACFISAIADLLEKNPYPNFGIGLIITNDEESDGINGTKKVLEWMKDNNYPISYCLVGEPTNPKKFGDMIKIGRRGSISFKIKIQGKQGHVAYPENALNPITVIINLLKILKDHKLDDGNEFFDRSNLEITNISSENLGSNVIPSEASAEFNIRFNNIHNSQDIINLVDYACKKTIGFGANYQLDYKLSGESFLSKPDVLAKVTQEVVLEITGRKPILSTSGGTSDARFIKDYSEVVEIGLVNETAHRVNEYSKIEEIEQLKNTYLKILEKMNSVLK